MTLNPTIHTKALQVTRQARQKIYNAVPSSVAPSTGGDPNLAKLYSSFSRYASTSQTAFDNGAAQSSAASGASILERQVDRVLSQVLGRAPGQGADSFISALNDAFPVGPDGRVTAIPSRNAVSMFSPDGWGTSGGALQSPEATRQSIAAGLTGQLSVEQAALYREGSTVAADATRVLSGLQAFAPIADLNQVEMLRAVVRSEISTLVQEFGRIDLPRPDRVESYFNLLLGPHQKAGHLFELGRRALVDGSWDPTSDSEEAQIAAFTLLRQYCLSLFDMWTRYAQRPVPKNSRSFSQQLQEATRMLTVVAESNNNFMAAMDAIGFDENERRSFGVTFDTLQFVSLGGIPANLQPALPNITVYDLTAWVDSLTNVEGQATLADAGVYGLDFVTDQADELFRTLATVLAAVRFGPPVATLLYQVLTHERVAWAVDDLFFQVKTLADLAA